MPPATAPIEATASPTTPARSRLPPRPPPDAMPRVLEEWRRVSNVRSQASPRPWTGSPDLTTQDPTEAKAIFNRDARSGAPAPGKTGRCRFEAFAGGISCD